MNRYFFKLKMFLIAMFFTACSIKESDIISLKLHQKIPKSAIIQSSQVYLTTSGALEQMYIFKENNNTFDVMTNNKGYITFIKSTDNRFISPCGIKEGDTLEMVKKISKKEPKYMLGWGYYVLLSNGWFAGLGNEKNIAVNQKISLDSKVKLLFKSVYH